VVQELTRRGHTLRLLARLDGRLWVSDDLQEFRPVLVPGIDRGLLRQVERVARRTQSVLRLPFLGWFDNLRFAWACHQELAGCDVFLERMSWIMAGGAWASRAMGVPLVLEYNGDPLADLQAKQAAPTGLQLRISRGQMRRVVAAAARIVATGDGWRLNCIETWNAAPHKVVTVENGTELVRSLARGELRAFQESPAEQPATLVYLGGFYAWHGVLILLQSLPQVLQRFPRARLLLIGAGPAEAEARRLVTALGLAEQVSFLGQMSMEACAPLLADADIGLSPYCGWPEYSGLKIFDYKAAGLPVIASGRDGMPRSVTGGETGIVIPPCDEPALAAALCELLSDPARRRAMGRRARLEAEDRHGWEHTAAGLEFVLEQAVQGRRAAGKAAAGEEPA
jgi:glycosyltransferase involved in cell wall biosynthesis